MECLKRGLSTYRSLIYLLAFVLVPLMSGCGGSSTAQSGKTRVPPPSTTIYFVKDSNDVMVPATPLGQPWPQCGEDVCGVGEPDVENADMFSMVLIKTGVDGNGDSYAIEPPKENRTVKSGNSQDPDGYCTVIVTYYPGIGWVTYYDPNDPDCPP